MVNIPAPSAENMMWFLLGLLIGLPAPYWYAQERIQGLVRVALAKLPYKPPPGKKKDEALKEAVEQDEGGDK